MATTTKAQQIEKMIQTKNGLVNHRMLAEDTRCTWAYAKSVVRGLAIGGKVRIENNGGGDVRLWWIAK